jgi:hypothetical protein
MIAEGSREEISELSIMFPESKSMIRRRSMNISKLTVCFLLLGISLFLTLNSAAGVEGDKEKANLPEIADLVSADPQIRDAAVGKLLRYQGDLEAKLREILLVNPDEDGKNDLKATACFLIGQYRMSSGETIDALIRVLDKNFMGSIIEDLPYGKAVSADALVKIGKPAVTKLFDVVSQDKNLRRREVALGCILLIEGKRITRVIIEDEIKATKEEKGKENLQEALRWLDEWK